MYIQITKIILYMLVIALRTNIWYTYKYKIKNTTKKTKKKNARLI